MTKYYGKVGRSDFGVDSVGIPSAWDGWIEMHAPKPEAGDWYAGENGEWMYGEAPEEIKDRVMAAKSQKMRLLTEANAMINMIEQETIETPELYVKQVYNPYTDEIDNVNEELEKWHNYRKELIRVDVEAKEIKWPELP